MQYAICLIFALFSLSAPALAAESDEFRQLLDDAWEWRMQESPVFASQLGDRRFNDRWSDMSLAAYERRHADQREFLSRLRRIDSSLLDATDQINYDLFRRQLEDSIDSYQYRAYLMPINQRGGVQSLESTAESLRLQSVQDYEDWLTRMTKVPEMIEQTMALQEAGRRDCSSAGIASGIWRNAR